MPSHKNREIKYQGILSDIHGYTSEVKTMGHVTMEWTTTLALEYLALKGKLHH